MSLLNSCFENKVVLVTGHTGFKGSWLTAWLKTLGAKVIGVSLPSISSPSHFSAASIGDGITDLRFDIRDQSAIKDVIASTKPDFLFHLAAQALVKKSYDDPLTTWETNLIGTLNVLEGLKLIRKECSAVLITSDKCYDNQEWEWGYRENDVLGGSDPYSASKASAEIAIRSYIKSFFQINGRNVRLASARAGNVIGGGDWADDRLVPDCVKAWSKGKLVELHSPNSTRPWQHVLEPLSGYLSLATSLQNKSETHGEAFNFGPNSNQNKSVLDVVEKMSQYWEQVKWSCVSRDDFKLHEAGLLKLNCDKALHYLDWQSVLDFDNTVRMTSEWYESFYKHPEDAAKTTATQIKYYTDLAERSGLKWAQ